MCPEQTVTYLSERSSNKIKSLKALSRGCFCFSGSGCEADTKLIVQSSRLPDASAARAATSPATALVHAPRRNRLPPHPVHRRIEPLPVWWTPS